MDVQHNMWHVHCHMPELVGADSIATQLSLHNLQSSSPMVKCVTSSQANWQFSKGMGLAATSNLQAYTNIDQKSNKPTRGQHHDHQMSCCRPSKKAQ